MDHAASRHTEINPIEPWLWGVLVPVPAIAFAVWLGAMFGSAFHAAQVGIAIATAVLAAVGSMAARRSGVCVAAFIAGVIATAMAAFGVVLYALSHMTFG